jgi:hypothetical protein
MPISNLLPASLCRHEIVPGLDPQDRAEEGEPMVLVLPSEMIEEREGFEIPGSLGIAQDLRCLRGNDERSTRVAVM